MRFLSLKGDELIRDFTIDDISSSSESAAKFPHGQEPK